MAFILCNFYSRVLGKDTGIHMIFPEYGQIGADKVKLCILIHGQGQDASFWIRRTNIEQIAELHNMAVIMPEASGSFFVPTPNEKNFKRFIAQELPEFLEHTFPFLSMDPEDHMITGVGEDCLEKIQEIAETSFSYYGRRECLPCGFTNEDLQLLLSK